MDQNKSTNSMRQLIHALAMKLLVPSKAVCFYLEHIYRQSYKLIITRLVNAVFKSALKLRQSGACWVINIRDDNMQAFRVNVSEGFLL